jgi:DNA replication and repair protein RecF
LLLDYVFSELEPARSTALLRHIPPGQLLLTTAGHLPPEAHPAHTVRLHDGMISP